MVFDALTSKVTLSFDGTFVAEFSDPSSGANFSPFISWGDRSSFDSEHAHYSFVEFEIGAPVNTAVPEPSTMLLLGSGLAGLVAWQLKVRNKNRTERAINF